MNKDIKDYLHLYLGCEVSVTGSRLTYENNYSFLERLDSNNYTFGWDMVKPILRPLITATGHETENAIIPLISAINSFDASGLNENKIKQCAELTRYLLSKHFDLFGLIESGLAIDKTKF